jgi:hypothetical protein
MDSSNFPPLFRLFVAVSGNHMHHHRRSSHLDHFGWPTSKVAPLAMWIRKGRNGSAVTKPIIVLGAINFAS